MSQVASPPAPVTVVHQIPGRLRLRAPRSHRSHDQLSRIRAALLKLDGITDVRTDHASGSILIRHGSGQPSLDHLSAALRAAGELELQTTFSRNGSAAGRTPIARELRGAATGLNTGVERGTSGLLDLRTLVPLGLVTIAILQVRENGAAGLLPPPSTALWYAFSLFMTFNVK